MNISSKFQLNRITNTEVVHISKQRLLFSFVLVADLFFLFLFILLIFLECFSGARGRRTLCAQLRHLSLNTNWLLSVLTNFAFHCVEGEDSVPKTCRGRSKAKGKGVQECRGGGTCCHNVCGRHIGYETMQRHIPLRSHCDKPQRESQIQLGATQSCHCHKECCRQCHCHCQLTSC